MDERIFDVSKPHKVNPGATSKPVIVGHHPEIPDPMIRENAPDKPQVPEQPEFGPPSDGNPLGLPEVTSPLPEAEETPALPTTETPEDKPELPPLLETEEPAEQKPAPASSDQPPPTAPMFNKATGQTVEPTHSSWKPEHELPIAGHHHKSGFKKTPLIIVAAVLGFLGIYALLDSGLVVEVDLPLHIFSPNEEPAQSQQPAAIVPSQTDQVTIEESTTELPDGKMLYTNETLGFKFVYPAEWGEAKANTSTDTNKLFIVDFNSEKDGKTDHFSIEIRGQAEDTEITGSDSPYSKGYILDDGKYYYRTAPNDANTVNNLITSEELIARVQTKGLGTALITVPNTIGDPFLWGLININSEVFPGMHLMFVHSDKDGNPINNDKSYTDEDIDALKQVLSTFETT